MKNMLPDLQNHIFSMIEKIIDDDLEGEKFKQEIERAMVFNELARTAVANGALMAKCADTLYGLPVSDKLPLIPPSPAEEPILVDGKRKSLLKIPRG